MKKLRAWLGIWLMRRAYDIMPEDDKQTFDTISFYGYQVLVGMRRLVAEQALKEQQSQPDVQSMLDTEQSPADILSSQTKPRLH